MKSIIIRDSKGRVILKILHRKSGGYCVEKYGIVEKLTVEIRNEKMHKMEIEV